MRRLRVGFTDTFDGTKDFFSHLLHDKCNFLQYGYSFDFSPAAKEDTDILIFGDENFGNQNTSYNPKRTVKIFYTGENRRYYNYPCHFGLTFDHIDDDKHFRLPLWLLVLHYLKTRTNVVLPNDTWLNRSVSDSKKPFAREFCGYVQSNPNCQKRNEFFDKLNAYKTITSAGPHKNNTGFILPRGEDGIQKKLQFLNKHKFTLAFENGSSPGYVTEKLIEAYIAGTIPIYWGSPTVEMEFNQDAFLNWHNLKNDEFFLDDIKAFDSISNHYNEMYNQPLIKPNVIDQLYENFEIWFLNSVLKRCFLTN